MSTGGAVPRAPDAITLYAIAGRRGPKQREIIEALGPVLAPTLAKWGITPGLEAALFLGQCATESDGFSTTTEYASGRAYEGRRDLGNTQPGDGVKYKGHALIQVTGRDNHRRCGLALGIDAENHPELLAQPEHALEASCWFWVTNRIGPWARKGDVLAVSRAVNLGNPTKQRTPNGWTERQSYTRKARLSLGV
ncbi:MAG: hypothetical protein RIR25_1084 [Verrucomicrobiota bacterium]|jgi:putative chitinase